MSTLDILLYPHPGLRKKSFEIKEINHEILKLLDDMSETMYEAPGVGLAAPQVGKNLRAITIDISRQESEKRELIELINPRITESRGSQLGEEGCLSIPGFVANVTRKNEIKVEGLNREGKKIEINANELLSRVLQHEIDHLNGILFFDRLGRLKRELLVKKINKTLKSINTVK